MESGHFAGIAEMIVVFLGGGGLGTEGWFAWKCQVMDGRCVGIYGGWRWKREKINREMKKRKKQKQRKEEEKENRNGEAGGGGVLVSINSICSSFPFSIIIQVLIVSHASFTPVAYAWSIMLYFVTSAMFVVYISKCFHIQETAPPPFRKARNSFFLTFTTYSPRPPSSIPSLLN